MCLYARMCVRASVCVLVHAARVWIALRALCVCMEIGGMVCSVVVVTRSVLPLPRFVERVSLLPADVVGLIVVVSVGLVAAIVVSVGLAAAIVVCCGLIVVVNFGSEAERGHSVVFRRAKRIGETFVIV